MKKLNEKGVVNVAFIAIALLVIAGVGFVGYRVFNGQNNQTVDTNQANYNQAQENKAAEPEKSQLEIDGTVTTGTADQGVADVNGVRLNGALKGDKAGATVWFEWGLSEASLDKQTTKETTPAFATDGDISFAGIIGQPEVTTSSTYYYRAVTEHEGKTSYGEVKSFVAQ